MPSKRTHPKSRSGCIACKQRHRKCDESIPVCSFCKRTGQNCKRDLTMRRYGANGVVPIASDISSPVDSMADATHSSREFGFEDLGLMHLFTTATCLSMAASDPEQQRAWQYLVPQEAQTQPYLMHGLLALAALHRVQLDNRREKHHLDIAVNHYNLALSKSRVPLAHLSEENSSSLFVLSILIGIFALGHPISPASPPLEDAIGQIVQVATLMRGALTIVMTQSASISKGPMSLMIRHGFSANPAILPQELEAALDQLEEALCLTESVGDGHSAYHETIQGLKACFRNVGFTAASPHGTPVGDEIMALSWLGVMHHDFVQLLSRRRPAALVLLSYYAVALHTLDAVWWCHGWSLMLVKEVHDSLDEVWRAKMNWPLQQINFTPDTDYEIPL